jgi:hypothetical protein
MLVNRKGIGELADEGIAKLGPEGEKPPVSGPWLHQLAGVEPAERSVLGNDRRRGRAEGISVVASDEGEGAPLPWAETAYPAPGVILGMHGEQDVPAAIELNKLRHLHLGEVPGSGHRRKHLPAHEVGGTGVRHHSAAVRGAGCRPRRDQGVERAVSVTAEQPWITPRLVAPAREVQQLIPSPVGFDDGIAWVLSPGHEVIGYRKPDALDQSAVCLANAGVEHVPALVVLDDAAGPGREVVPGPARSRG